MCGDSHSAIVSVAERLITHVGLTQYLKAEVQNLNSTGIRPTSRVAHKEAESSPGAAHSEPDGEAV